MLNRWNFLKTGFYEGIKVQAHGYEFDIGLSFASEQRKYVERVAEELNYRGIRVYYDAYDQANL